MRLREGDEQDMELGAGEAEDSEDAEEERKALPISKGWPLLPSGAPSSPLVSPELLEPTPRRRTSERIFERRQAAR